MHKLSTLNIATTEILRLYWALSDEAFEMLHQTLKNDPPNGRLNIALAERLKDSFCDETDNRFLDIIIKDNYVSSITIGTKKDGVKFPSASVAWDSYFDVIRS